MAKGLWRLHHAAQTAQAKRDFAALVTMAVNAGRADLAKKYFYPEGAGWRVIDKHLARLRTALAEQGKESR